ncbi:MAG: protein kinase [Bryobacter sp.]|nr:protein kinase [Bryobacter sp.]
MGTQEHFARAEELFHQALGLPEAQRANFLWQACEGDTSLFDWVHQLLKAEAADAQFQPKAAGEPPTAKAGEWRAGQMFGHYRIVRLLGKGGMGAVYLAERADGAFQQQVALKLLAPHLVEETFAERFRAERQMLAQLNHPNIVHLVDGGVSEAGEPYFVTEYIEGQTLDRHAQAKRLRVEERIRLFLQVCRAVEYAHQNLVVHRDLKPSNVLVTEEGAGESTAKLLDFGTAKLVTATERTATSNMLLTPRYASPEQLRNEAITTRSDVYSLGMMLYELLSGARPFASTGDAVGELARAFEYTHPTALGKNVTAEAAAERRSTLRELTQTLAGDLRAIAAKALQHEPAQRYSGVGELVADLTAYLEGRPVKARGAGFGYVAKKFILRQRYAVGAAVLLVVAIGIGIGATLREKARAERRFTQVRQLARYQLFDLFAEAERLPQSTMLRARIVQEALAYLDNLRQDVGQDRSLQRELVEGYLRAGNILGNFTKDNLGDLAKAKEAYAKGRDLAGTLEGEGAQWLRARLGLADALADYGSGKNPDVAARVESAVKAMEPLVAADSKVAEEHLQLGLAYMNLAKVRQSSGHLVAIEDKSREWVEKAKASLLRAADLEPENDEVLGALHTLCGNRAVWLSDGAPKEALGWAGQAEMWGVRRKVNSNSPSYLTAEANRLTGRAAALNALGDTELAWGEMKQATALLRRVAEDKYNFGVQLNLVSGLLNQAMLEYELKQKQAYAQTVDEAMAVVKGEQAKGRGEMPILRSLYWKVLYDLTYAYLDIEHPRAETVVKEAYDTFREIAAQDPQNERVRFYLCDMLLNLGTTEMTRPEEARRYAMEMIAAQPENPNGYDFWAQAEVASNNWRGAIEAYQKAKVALNKTNKGAAGEKFNQFYDAKIAELEKKL